MWASVKKSRWKVVLTRYWLKIKSHFVTIVNRNAGRDSLGRKWKQPFRRTFPPHVSTMKGITNSFLRLIRNGIECCTGIHNIINVSTHASPCPPRQTTARRADNELDRMCKFGSSKHQVVPGSKGTVLLQTASASGTSVTPASIGCARHSSVHFKAAVRLRFSSNSEIFPVRFQSHSTTTVTGPSTNLQIILQFLFHCGRTIARL